MDKAKFQLLLLSFLLLGTVKGYAITGKSVYNVKPIDKEAIYLDVPRDGKTDVTLQIQEAVNRVKREKNFGILFIPEGKYLISNTIYIPASVRLIGYGKQRPEIILKKNAPGFQQEISSDKGHAKYMFWFTGGLVEEGQEPHDANPGTFYSALSNIDLRILGGNPYAVALRTHFAQHGYISHVTIHIGQGKAGIFDLGNELEDVSFIGGDYGIYTTKASPGWPVAMVDAYFEGQRKAALHCQESGLAIIGLKVKNVPTVFEIRDNYCDRLYVEHATVEQAQLLVNSPVGPNANNQVSLRDVYCKDVKQIIRYGEKETTGLSRSYCIRTLDYGLRMDSLTDEPVFRTSMETEPIAKLPTLSDITPAIPMLSECVNLKDFGAVGDGETDDTEALQKAIDRYDNIYVPQGWYRVTKTLRMREHTRLIGLHPMGTQLLLKDRTEGFCRFGAPAALLESSERGDNILTGIGINTGQWNQRAVGVKWMAGEKSYMNDVKFVGGHGSMQRPQPQKEQAGTRQSGSRRDMGESAWDNQHWSLWITCGGGGTLKDIWTASTFATNGLYVENTSTPSRLIAVSIEHHVRNEVRFRNVSNYKIYAMQTEEENRESSLCQPIEMDDCHDMMLTNLYMFRVIRVNIPYHSSVRLRNCKNVEFLNLYNFAQTKFSNTISVYDQSKEINIRPWVLQRLVVTGDEQKRQQGDILATDFEFAEGIATDSHGNAYFCDHRMRRIWRWDAEREALSLVADFPWKPQCIGFDTEDHLLVLFRYDPLQGEQVETLPDADGTSFSGWGNSGYALLLYTFDPTNPEETIELLPLVKMGSVNPVARALYSSNRWRDAHDFNTVVSYKPEKCFLAPDGKTIIPQQYDLARTSQLLAAVPGEPFYCADEYDRRMVRLNVANDGTLSDLQYFVPQAEFGSAIDPEGNIYVADGDIYAFSPDGQRIARYETTDRPSTIAFGGKDGRLLLITGRQTLMGIKTNQE